MKKKCQATASDVPTNIVYKHKKTVYWITDNSTNTEKTSISFFSTKKAATKHKNNITKMKNFNFILTGPSAHLSILNEMLAESFSLNILSESPQWYLLVNNSWKYLGWELSSAIEVAFENGLSGFSFNKFIQVTKPTLKYHNI